MDNADSQQDLSMAEMWQEAAVRFKERTGTTLSLKPAKTLDDCIAEIEKRQLPAPSLSTETVSTRDKAKQYGINILRCLKLLGGVAAEGAEMVFAPSSLCFNALSLLLDVPENIQDFHSAVDGLFETLGPSLGVFRIYERIEQFKNIEPELKQAIQRVMISFIDICALYIKLRNSGRWRKFKAATKLILLDDDSGVKSEVEHFKTLTAAHGSVQATQTLKTVLESNSSLTAFLTEASETGRRIEEMAVYVIGLRDADDKRKSEETRRKHLVNIRDKLGIQEKALKASKEAYDELWHICVPGTGSWMVNADGNPAFREWAERNNAEAKPMFLLNGDPNTGKSVVMSSISHHLRSIYEAPDRQSPRTLVASYFFPSFTGKSDEDRRPVETALKCIAMQLAEQDGVCARKMSQACDGRTDAETFFHDATCEGLWDLISACVPRAKTTAHFLLLDGLGSLPSGQRATMEMLFAILDRLDSEQSPIRVLLSVRPDSLATMGACKWPKIDMEKHNAEDIRRYIDHELKAKDMFQDADDSSVRIGTRIRDRLANEVGGSYYKVTSAIGKIEEVVLNDGEETDVDRVLDESSKDERAISQTVIRTLEETLQAREIAELNELLVWVIFGFCTFHLDLLDAALSLRFKTRTLLKLTNKLKGKYGKIFHVLSDGYVDIAEDMEANLQKERTQSRVVDEAPTFSATITIAKADLTSVQSFLWSFMQKANQDTLGFQQLTDQTGIKGTIGVNRFDAHLSIVQQTFSILAEAPDLRTRPLASYLLNYLPQHLEVLEEATGIDALTPAEKQMVGEGLFSLVVSGEVIERHWGSCDALVWFREDDEVRVFRRWLADPSVTSRLGRLDREWLRDVEADQRPNRALLAKLAKTVARHWLRDTDWEVRISYEWLRGLLMLSGAPESTERPSDTPDSSKSSEAVAESVTEITVESAADWCRQVLVVSELDSLWYRRLGETFYEVQGPGLAVDAFHSALSLGDASAEVYEGLAKALAMQGKLPEACDRVNEALKLLDEDDGVNRPILIRIYTHLSTWYTSLNEPKRAAEYMKKVIGLSPDDHASCYALLKLHLMSDDGSHAAEFLEDLTGASDVQDEPGRFGNIVSDMFGDWQHETVLPKLFTAISENSNLFARILQELDRAIARAQKAEDLPTMAEMLLYKGAAIYHYSNDTASATSAIACWSKCLDVKIDSDWSSNYSTASRLLSAYHFDRARASDETAVRQKDVERLKHLQTAETRSRLFSMSAAKAYLASYYTINREWTSARTVVKGCLYSAFDLLSDDTEENDSDAIYMIACILMHCGDERNAISAFSMLPPRPDKGNVLAWLLDFEEDPARDASLGLIRAIEEEDNSSSLNKQIDLALGLVGKRIRVGADATLVGVYEEIQARLRQVTVSKNLGSLGYWCDGPCGRKWDFENAMHACKFCYDRGFCDQCLEMLQQGQLKSPTVSGLVCNKSHEWLLLPKWDKQRTLDVVSGNTRTGGQFEGGVCVGGEAVSTKTWLADLKREWGYVENDKSVDGQEDMGGADKST
ncbi:nacht and tpr domain containing protein [Grosmannia clavigera kw1407]|uniref:Nacht and tpr domain containing protein n=1 Tax=Grosmannia clavigera (strain kw1407 / UAMH 11150) TaxID=655863 RepID=F0XMR4_GROCL|nr:nacht and tpr domain containing protein [Grosmannia clavigera kw1407]EFX01558.1 nacht and tpr domain containing protein [Grosmannia clavigera kw1407]